MSMQRDLLRLYGWDEPGHLDKDQAAAEEALPTNQDREIKVRLRFV